MIWSRHTILGLAVVALNTSGRLTVAHSADVTTTVYVGRHFEVRDHDQPVKYVFNGDQRVARVTGALQSPVRVQRLRVRAGWNCVSLGVTATNLAGQLNQAMLPALVKGLYQWEPVTQRHVNRGSGQTVEAGSVLWVNMRADAVVGIVGTCPTVEATTVPVGGGFVPARGLLPWSSVFPVGVTAWKHQPQLGNWEMFSTGELASISAAPPQLAPGEAIYVQTEHSFELPAPGVEGGVLYYHEDHLGSAGSVTDQAGQITEETAYYAFGGVRHQDRPAAIAAHYGFTQKERDIESGLSNFGHRYYHAGLGRWLSPDPLGEGGGGQNLYAYVNQNPLRFHDPDGAEITAKVDNEKKPTRYTLTVKAVLLDTSSKKFDQAEMAQFKNRIQSSIERNFTSKPDPKQKVHWSTKVDMRVVTSWSDVKADDHVFQIVDRLNSAGETTTGGMLMKIRVNRFTDPHPSQVDQTRPENKGYTLENFTSMEGTANHELGHAGGLSHDDTHDNLMQQGSVRSYDNQTVKQPMIHQIWKAYKADKLNKPEQELINRRNGK